MTAADTVLAYQTSVAGSLPHDSGPIWDARIALPETTDTQRFAVVLFGGVVVAQTTWREPFLQVIDSQDESSLKEKLLTHLATLKQTPVDERWLGVDWPEDRAFEDAAAFIRRLPLALIPMPDIGLADDGEVNFLWEIDSVHVDLGFYGTGTCSYFARGKDGRRFHGEDVPASEGLPPEIITLLTA